MIFKMLTLFLTASDLVVSNTEHGFLVVERWICIEINK